MLVPWGTFHLPRVGCSFVMIDLAHIFTKTVAVLIELLMPSRRWWLLSRYCVDQIGWQQQPTCCNCVISIARDRGIAPTGTSYRFFPRTPIEYLLVPRAMGKWFSLQTPDVPWREDGQRKSQQSGSVGKLQNCVARFKEIDMDFVVFVTDVEELLIYQENISIAYFMLSF